MDAIVVATTDQPADDLLADVVAGIGLACFRGSEIDVLGRVVSAHQMMNTELIVAVTGDCPLLDPKIIDLGVETFLDSDFDVVTNVQKRSFPMGIDVQVFLFASLAEIQANIRDPAIREHVSLFFYEHPERYRILHLTAPEGYQAPEQRLLLDYPDDLRLINEIYRRLEPCYGNHFGTPEILALLAAEPTLTDINRHCVEKSAR